MFELTVNGHFDAAHYLKSYQGKCAKLHGHTWQVEVRVRGNNLDDKGILIDFSLLKKYLKAVTEQLDHKLINEVEPFNEINPTAENISRYIYDQCQSQLNAHQINVYSVTVWESPRAAATYWGAD